MAEVAINSWTRYGEDRGLAPDAVEPNLRAWARNLLVSRTDAWMSAIGGPQDAGASKLAHLLATDAPASSPADTSERMVGSRLDKLTAHGWRVLHSIHIGPRDGDTDHVLIGPGGVFCLTVRNFAHSRVWVSDKVVWVDGESQPLLRSSQLDGERASRMLSRATGSHVAVHPVLVIVGDRYRATNHRRDVRVLGRRDVPRAFATMPTTYSPDEVATIHAAAQRPETWA